MVTKVKLPSIKTLSGFTQLQNESYDKNDRKVGVTTQIGFKLDWFFGQNKIISQYRSHIGTPIS